jgi:Fe2+ or Zn2+ uptake regulation protein
MENLPNPTEAELEILQTLWQTGSCSVKQVHGILQEKREVGYTTILKQLQIMLEKGLVQRDESARIHLYQATISERNTKEKLVQKFDGGGLTLRTKDSQPGKENNTAPSEVSKMAMSATKRGDLA